MKALAFAAQEKEHEIEKSFHKGCIQRPGITEGLELVFRLPRNKCRFENILLKITTAADCCCVCPN